MQGFIRIGPGSRERSPERLELRAFRPLASPLGFAVLRGVCLGAMLLTAAAAQALDPARPPSQYVLDIWQGTLERCPAAGVDDGRQARQDRRR